MKILGSIPVTALLLVGFVALVLGMMAGVASAQSPSSATGEDGYWYNDTIEFDSSDGVSDEELDALVSRGKARVEYLRQREFIGNVSVNITQRESLTEDFSNTNGTNSNTTNQSNINNASEWNNQVWEALFIVGENKNITEEIQSTTAGAVGGFYSGNQIRVVTGGGSPEISETTLIHELVHAMQDEYYNLSSERFDGEVQDEQLAVRGLLEGEANYIQTRFRQECRTGWQCFPGSRVSDGGGSNQSRINFGVFVVMFQPYSDGPAYIHSLVQRGGWDAVDEAFQNPPNTSESIIHVTDEGRVNMTFNNTARNGWQLYENQGINGYDIAGEASIYSTFWYQSHPAGYGLGIINLKEFLSAEGEFDKYNYVSPPSDGWGNDRIYPYSKGDKRGYVWKTVWDTDEDAREFHRAYLRILEGHDAEKVGTGTWRIPDGDFADAFRVKRNGTTVTIVNAPTVDDLDDIRPNMDGSPNPTPGSGSGSVPSSTEKRLTSPTASLCISSHRF
ncbi:MAG: Hvo_1808 family surface protein [Halobacteria archaeon]|nr:Hvo_1808 family surface protein [Halobacteria archaeon]